MSRFQFWGFKSPHEVLHNSLGSLEREILEICWKHPDVNVSTACSLLKSTMAYTTVMTTMDRLFKKGLLERRKSGRAFVYNASATRSELEGAMAAELVQSLFSRDEAEPLPILSSLVDAVSDRDRALLDELERLLREKRRAIERETEK
jgi:predicted transcriptional regulator